MTVEPIQATDEPARRGGRRRRTTAEDPAPDAKPSQVADTDPSRQSSPSSDAREQADARIPDEISHPRLAEAIRTVLSRYELATGEAPPQVIAVVSALHGEGVSVVSRALTEVLAVDYGSSSCWVDLSWPSGKRRKSSGRDGTKPGLLDVVRGDCELADALVQSTPNPNLRHLQPGEVPARGRPALLRAPRLVEVLEEIREQFDHVVFDCAPILSGAGGLSMVRHADAHMLVTRWGATSTAQVTAAAEELRNVPSVGSVLNAYRTRTPAFVRRMLGQ